VLTFSGVKAIVPEELVKKNYFREGSYTANVVSTDPIETRATVLLARQTAFCKIFCIIH